MSDKPNSQSDVAIVGAGPVGLFAAYYAGFRGLSVALIDSLPELGGQISAMYPEKYVYDTPGFPKILGKDLVKELVVQASQFHPQVYLDEQAVALTKLEERRFRIETSARVHESKAVLLSAGAGSFTPQKLGNAEVDRFEGKGLTYVVRQLSDYQGKRVVILGGGDSAVDWVLNLKPFARHITIVHRRDEFRAHEDSVRQMRALNGKGVDVKTPYEVKCLTGDGSVAAAVVFHNATKQEETIPCDVVVSCLGFVTNVGPMKNWGLDFEGNQLKVNSRMETNVPGVYGAGDLVTYPGKVRLIALGYGEAAIAANHIAAYVNPKAAVFPGHSSNIVPEKEKKEAAAKT